jgi:hypothetical protein
MSILSLVEFVVFLRTSIWSIITSVLASTLSATVDPLVRNSAPLFLVLKPYLALLPQDFRTAGVTLWSLAVSTR